MHSDKVIFCKKLIMSETSSAIGVTGGLIVIKIILESNSILLQKDWLTSLLWWLMPSVLLGLSLILLG